MKVIQTEAEIKHIKKGENARERKKIKRENDTKQVKTTGRPSSAPSIRERESSPQRPGSAGGQDFYLVNSKFPRAMSLSPRRR